MSDHLRPSATGDACTDPAGIVVRTGTEQFAVFCVTCWWRTPVVVDRRTAWQHFDTEHGGQQ